MAFFILVLVLFLFLRDNLSLTQNLHHLCLTGLNFNSSFPDIYQALICGKRLPYGSVREIFVKGGLIHLMIVSGAHLIFLERLLIKAPIPKSLNRGFIYLSLILYACVSQLNPPVLRALFSFFLLRFSRKYKLFWSPVSITLLSGVLCVIYKPETQDSFSLQLSVLTSLLYHSCRDSLKRSFLIYLFVLPIINHWQDLSSLTVFINWILAPVISAFLFPLSFLSAFFPFLYPLSDRLWLICLKVLQGIQFLPFQQSLYDWRLPKEWIWFYIIFLWVFLARLERFFIRIKIKRRATGE